MTKQNKHQVKTKILDAAENLFAQKGFDATGINAIAKKAGITKSLIYYYFKSKDEILSELFNIFVKKTVDMKQKITNHWIAEPSTGVDKIIHDYTLPFMMENKNVIKIAFTESVKDIDEEPHLNIFKYFDQNFNASYDIAEKMGFKSTKDQNKLISSFFLFFAPLFSFVIFSDEWCDHYNIDLPTASNLFADAIGKTYSFFAKEEIRNISLEEILDSREKS